MGNCAKPIKPMIEPSCRFTVSGVDSTQKQPVWPN